jgi:hypothetical protein
VEFSGKRHEPMNEAGAFRSKPEVEILLRKIELRNGKAGARPA